MARIRFGVFGVAAICLVGVGVFAALNRTPTKLAEAPLVSAEQDGGSALGARAQQLDEGIVEAEDVSLKAAGYVVAYENANGAPGRVLGTSELMDEGSHPSIQVDISESEIDLGESVFLLMHVESGENERFDINTDAVVSDDDGVLLVKVDISSK